MDTEKKRKVQASVDVDLEATMNTYGEGVTGLMRLIHTMGVKIVEIEKKLGSIDK